MKQRKTGFYPAVLAVLLAMCMLFTACGTEENKDAAGGGGGDFSAVAGDYYLDLSELGMGLTIYLRLSEDGSFQFSNTTDFATNKSSGTMQEGAGEYMMVYETVNGEEKSVSDGLTSSFAVKEDGTLDFGGCEKIYYGSASAVTKSEDDPDVVLMAVPLPADYEEQGTESDFTAGTYTAQGDGVSYVASFYEDSSYLLMEIREEEGAAVYASETGTYGVSTTQLAVTPSGASRLSGEVISATELSIPVPSEDGDDRTAVTMTRQEAVETDAVLTGQVDAEDGAGAAVTVTLYSDGTFVSEANGFEEGGVLVLDSASGTFKIYPDHPETAVRGLNQISTVPSGTFAYQDGKLTLTDFRLRTSESLTREKCSLTQE